MDENSPNVSPGKSNNSENIHLRLRCRNVKRLNISPSLSSYQPRSSPSTQPETLCSTVDSTVNDSVYNEEDIDKSRNDIVNNQDDSLVAAEIIDENIQSLNITTTKYGRPKLIYDGKLNN